MKSNLFSEFYLSTIGDSLFTDCQSFWWFWPFKFKLNKKRGFIENEDLATFQKSLTLSLKFSSFSEIPFRRIWSLFNGSSWIFGKSHNQPLKKSPPLLHLYQFLLFALCFLFFRFFDSQPVCEILLFMGVALYFSIYFLVITFMDPEGYEMEIYVLIDC